MEKSKSSSNNRPAAPDGGYGWVIVLATFLQISVIVQILPLFGVIFGAKFEEFESSHTEKSGIVSVFLVLSNTVFEIQHLIPIPETSFEGKFVQHTVRRGNVVLTGENFNVFAGDVH